MTLNDAAAILGCDPRAVESRLVALGLVSVCSRCAGSGKFSRNRVDGDKCYGCNGRKATANMTAENVAEAKRRQDAGELDGYFAANRAKNEARRALTEAKAIVEDLDGEGSELLNGECEWQFETRVVKTASLATLVRRVECDDMAPMAEIRSRLAALRAMAVAA